MTKLLLLMVSCVALGSVPAASFADQYPNCSYQGHHHCYNPPGSTLPACRGGHKGPNGTVIECK